MWKQVHLDPIGVRANQYYPFGEQFSNAYKAENRNSFWLEIVVVGTVLKETHA